MSPRPNLEDQLAELSQLRDEPASQARLEALRKAFADRSSNHVVAKAAQIAAELECEELVPAMVEAFDRLLAGGAKRDKTCAGKIALAKALLDLEAWEEELFARGSRHVQLEAAYGPPVDTAAELRAQCAFGLVQSGHPTTALELARLLADGESLVRQGAARALAAWGRTEGEALLRLKALVGDEEAEVVGACLEGLLRLEPQRSLEFIEPLLVSDDAETAEIAAYALGSSRLDAALEVLKRPLAEGEPAGFDPERRRPLLGAIAMLRREEALDFLVEWVCDGDRARAEEALSALAIHRDDAALRERLEAAVAEREDGDIVGRTIERLFGS